MKYRLLSLSELEELEKEFVDYLVLNGITADEWVKIKAEDEDKTNRIIELFSDVVFEGVMRNVKFLDMITPKSIKCFQCLNDKMILVGLDANESSPVNFTTQSLADIQSQYSESLSVYTTDKAYSKVREQELFELTEKGASISDGGYFKQLCLIL